MKITTATPGAEHIVALDAEGRVIGHLVEIDTEKMEGFRIGKVYDKEPGPTGRRRYFEPVSPQEIGVGRKHQLTDLVREVVPVKIAELIDRRTGKPWVSDG